MADQSRSNDSADSTSAAAEYPVLADLVPASSSTPSASAVAVTPSQPLSAVHVSNISPSATEKTISDFFSFCGEISKLLLRKNPKSPGDTQEAIVFFDTLSAAKTALLLTNALIVDRPIAVVTFDASKDSLGEGVVETAVIGQDIEQKPYDTDDSQRTKTSVIASMIAAGYTFGNDIIQAAVEYDEKHSITQHIKAGGDFVKAKVTEIDDQYHISEKVMSGVTAVKEKAQQVDQSLGISDKATKAAGAAKETGQNVLDKASEAAKLASSEAQKIVDKASENEYIGKGLGALKDFGSMISTTGMQLENETRAAIEEKKKAKEETRVEASSDGDNDVALANLAESAASVEQCSDEAIADSQPEKGD